MMKKFQFLMMSLLSAFVLSACSNSDDGNNTTNGYVTFFHAVSDGAQLDLNGDDRDFGSISYEKFSNGILLEAKTWDLEVVDPDPQDSSSDSIILDTNFSVATDKRRIVALTGTLASPQLHTLELSEDTEADGDSGEDEDNIYINVSHINPSLNEVVSVYFLDSAEAAGFDAENLATLPATADASLAFGETKEDLIFSSKDQRLVVVNNAGTEVEFDSGDKELKDALHQTLLITDSSGAPVSVHYYGIGGSDGLFTDTWRNTSSGAAKGYLKVVNLLKDQLHSALSVEATITSIADSSSVNTGSLSYVADNSGDYQYYELNAGGYRVTLDETGSTVYNVLIEAGVAKTMYFFGRLNTTSDTIETPDSPMLVIDDKREVGSNAKLQFVHLWYQEDEEDLVEVNVHLLDSSAVPSSTTDVLKDISFKTESNVFVADDTGYDLNVTSTDNVTTYDWIDLPLSEGDVKQVLLYESASGGAAVIDMTQSLEP